MEFADFEIRAWRKGANRVQLLVHRAPAGETPAPVEVRVSERRLTGLATSEGEFADFDGRRADIGAQLGAILFPGPIGHLLDESLAILPRDCGLRVRLCLDETLQAIPWELAYRPPSQPTRSVLDGFVVLNPRISLVRGAPSSLPSHVSAEPPRLLFAGALGPAGDDPMRVGEELEGLSAALAPMQGLVTLEPAVGTAGRVIEEALSREATLFHYAGHADVDASGGYLVKVFVGSTERLYSDTLGRLLAHAGTQVAVFTACNSAHPQFATPLVRAGVPAVVTLHGQAAIETAIAFSERLYRSLAVSISIDHAVISARQHLATLAGRGTACEWARPCVYMSAREMIRLPRHDGAAGEQRDAVLDQERRTMHRNSLRRAMARAFSTDDLRLLCADVEQLLGEAGVQEPFNLDVIGASSKGLELQILDMIGYAERRGWLPYFSRAVAAARPELTAVVTAA